MKTGNRPTIDENMKGIRYVMNQVEHIQNYIRHVDETRNNGHNPHPDFESLHEELEKFLEWCETNRIMYDDALANFPMQAKMKASSATAYTGSPPSSRLHQ